MMSCQQNRCAILEHEGAAYGVFLASDYVGQHECGIDRINRRLGIAPGQHRFDGYRVATELTGRLGGLDMRVKETFYDERRRWTRTSDSRLVSFDFDHDDTRHAEDVTRRHDEATVIAGAFDDSSFAFRGYGERGIAAARMLEEGLLGGDAALWFAGNANPFGRGGIILLRPSLTPPHKIAEVDDAHDEAERLAAAAEATGIVERLKAGIRTRFGSPYYALAPAWTSEARRNETAHPVMFFLNPTEQSENNFGWYSVEQLDAWIDGKGPIPKKGA